MKHLTLFIITMFFTTLIFANGNKNRIHRYRFMNSDLVTLQCQQQQTEPAMGSYVCNGIPYSVTVSATASATADDCGTASAEAAGLALLYANSALQTSLKALQASCNVQ